MQGDFSMLQADSALNISEIVMGIARLFAIGSRMG
jgi:hypothetical protein